MENTKRKSPKKSSVKDYITLGIIIVLHFVIFTLSTPLGMSPVGNIFVYPACALLWGVLFILLCKKTTKPIIIFLYPFILGLVQIMNFWLTGVIGIVGAIATFLIWKTMDKTKFKTIVASYTTMITFMYLGGTLPVIFFKDTFFEIAPAYAELYHQVYDILVGSMFYVGLVATIACAVIGAFLGKVILKKHFEKSGIMI